MFPKNDFQAVIDWLRSPSVPTFALIRSLLAVAQFLATQAVSGGEETHKFTAGPVKATSKEELAKELEEVCASEQGYAAAGPGGVDWKKLLTLVMQIIAGLI